MFDTIWHLVMNILKVGDIDCLAIVRRRLGSEREPTTVAQQLLELDEGLLLLDRREVEQVVKEQARLKEKEPFSQGVQQ